MASCLGLYIEDNLIKYAKVSKYRERLKVDSFGVKFYENIEKAIEQIVQETDSSKTPISINTTNEMYNYFDMSTLINNKDLPKAIETEFEMYCSDKGYNPNVFLTKYAVANNPEDKEKLRVIHMAENKIELSKKTQQLAGFKLSNITPISMSISNLLNVRPRENYLVVNIEDETTITTILDQNIYDVRKIEKGSKDFLAKINEKENSYSKSYEICKNTTIYTSYGNDVLEEDSESYLNDIMPTLMEISEEVRKITNESLETINKIYLTGTGTLINNIDLYFQEYITDIEFEILKPYFIGTEKGLTIKDYIEVNSAISLALSGLGVGFQKLNFKEQSFYEALPSWMKLEIGGESKSKAKRGLNREIDLKEIFRNDLGEKLDKTEISLIRVAVTLLLLFIVYSGLSIGLNIQMDNKSNEADDSISNTNLQIASAQSDNNQIRSKTNEYSTMIKNLQDLNDKMTDATRSKKAIPNLLNSIMYVIPENVQITSIQNTTDRHVVIEARSDKYEQLGMFKAKIQNDVLLTNVISTAGQKDSNVVTVKIEGELP